MGWVNCMKHLITRVVEGDESVCLCASCSHQTGSLFAPYLKPQIVWDSIV